MATGSKFLLNLPPELLQSVKARARDDGLPASEVVRMALRSWLADGTYAAKGLDGQEVIVPPGRAAPGDRSAMADAVAKIGERQKRRAHIHKAASRLPSGVTRCACGAVNAGGGWLLRP